MCGIVGMAALRGAPAPEPGRLRAMCQTIVHRGPDDEGIHVDGRVGIGMRRLSIIDLAGGHQPIFNEDHTVSTVFNGEIYNYRELRRDLAGRGHAFRTHSDTEVIVHAYEEYGPAFADRLNGMFAIAVYDSAKHKVCLARDHIGIKPLYYWLGQDYLVWGSEIKAVLASGVVPRQLDIDALGQFLAWEYVPGEQTLLKSVRKLPAGHTLEIDLDRPVGSPRAFWDVPQPDSSQALTEEDWEQKIDEKLRECVQRQLVSDVPLGAFLSGGVDSSLVVSAMTNPTTFSIGFDDPSYNELEFAQKVATFLGVRHTYEVIEPRVVHLFDKLMYLLDDPIGDFSIFPTFLVSQVARKHVKVALSGDGGDELFGGYETYLADQKARQFDRIPAYLRHQIIIPWIHRLKPRAAKKGLINKAKRFIEGVEYPASLSHARWRLFANEVLRDTLFTAPARQQLTTGVGDHILRLSKQAEAFGPLSRSLYIDVKSYLVDNILTKVDRMSMGTSLETRVPLLDKELVELAFEMPDAFKLKKGETKYLLKKIASRHIPRECVYRPKEGFSIPIKHWLGTQFRPLVEEHLNQDKITNDGIFEWSVVNKLKDEHLRGQANHSHILWSLIVFQAWKSKWLEHDSQAFERDSVRAYRG